MGAKICEQWESMKGPDGRVMDALLSPAAQHAAVRHDQFVPHVIYTGAWNLMDFPAATMPVLRANAELDAKTAHQPEAFHSPQDEEVWKRYEEELVDGMPVSIQVVGRRLEEEKLLAVVKRITETL